MRKFKLIQEYPNSNKLGTVYSEQPCKTGNYFVSDNLLESSDRLPESDILDARYFKEVVCFEDESKKVVRQMLETLEKFLTSEVIVNQNVIDYINHDIDYVTVNYLRHEPDGETQANLWVNVKMSDIDAIHLLSTRICNTLQTI